MLLHVKIKPNQRFDRIERVEDQWVIRLKAPAVDGKANEYLLGFLSSVLALPKSQIVLKKGHTSKHKTLEISSTTESVEQRLRGAMEA